MPLDVERVLAAEIPETTHHWDADDVILYHLGVGAGVPPTDTAELEYAYEPNLKVLPSFATIPSFGSMMSVLHLDGLDVNPAMILHGEQVIELSGPIPTGGSITNRARVSHVYDTPKGAVVVLEIVSVDASGTVMFTNTSSIFIRGEGGFGGDAAPDSGDSPPEREPDHVVVSRTLPQQALLYRLSGDKNPLHADPDFAALVGFERPILHGLCSYGIVCKAAVGSVFGGDVGALRRFRARFAGVVYPGESIVSRFWEADGRWIVRADTVERDSPVISHASIEVAPAP
jgi:acyl dehydratase